MTTPAQKLAGRIAVAVLLVMLAAGSVFAAVATLPATSGPTLAEPSETASPRAEKSPKPEKAPKPEKSPDTDKANDPDKAADADWSPSAANLARIVDRLKAANIKTTPDELAALAAKVGVGGAVRVLRFAQASGKEPADIVAMRDKILAMREDGKGWGVIARELTLNIGPGNGSVMGRGHGQDTAAKAADRAARTEAKAARAAQRAARAAQRAQQRAGSGD